MGGAKSTYKQLRTVLTYTSTDIVEGACAAIPVPRSAIGGDGLIMDESIRRDIAKVLTALVGRVVDRRNTP
jgi:chromate reductase